MRTTITPEQFDVVYAALPDADAQLLVETAIESGLRWGELAELRVRDLDLATRMLTISRKVIEVNREFHPDGRRFLVELYPKDKEYRRLKLSAQIAVKLKAHIKARDLGLDDLLFATGSGACANARGYRAGHPRIHQAQRHRPPVPAWDAQRLQRRSLPVPALPAPGAPRFPPGGRPAAGRMLRRVRVSGWLARRYPRAGDRPSPGALCAP